AGVSAVTAEPDALVVEGRAVALVDARDDVDAVFLCGVAEGARGGAGDRFGHVGVFLAGADDGDPLGQADHVRLLLRGLVDQAGELFEVLRGRLAVAGPVIDGGEANLPRRRRAGFVEARVVPDDFAARRPAQVQFQTRLGRL